MLKILFILSNLSGGGAEKTFIDLLNHTDYSSKKVDLCLMTKTGKYIEQIPEEVKVIALFSRYFFLYKLLLGLSKYFHFDSCFRYWVRYKVTENYDIIVSFVEGIPLKIHDCLIDRSSRNVSWIHTSLCNYHYTKKYFYNDREERKCYARMDHLVFVSESARKNFDLLFSFNNCKSVVHNPIDRNGIINRAGDFTVEKRKFTICSVGRLIDAKGYDRLLRVARLLLDKHVEVDFWILGEGPLKSSLLQLQKQLRLEDYVHFLGFKQNPYPYISAADIFLSTSLVEGYPLVIAEALCLGRPVVSTNIPGSIEVIGEAGILVDHNIDSIFQILDDLIKSPVKLQNLHQLALERSKVFDIKKKVEEIYQLLD